jgi:DNA-binding CsgD family transcriptional regulator/tetratricopeptide (TPR) repeat protein
MEYLQGRDSGREKLELSLALAQENGLEEDAGRAYIHLCWVSVRNREYERAAAYKRDGEEYCTARDLDLHRHYVYCHWGRAALDLGRWDEAAESVGLVIDDRRSAPDARATALSVLGMLRARRGDPATWEALDAASALLEGGDLQRKGPVAIARAEALWHEGRLSEIDDETAATFRLALDCRAPWVAGELAIWRRRAGLDDDLGDGTVAEPFALSLAGDWAGAAECWRELGCPYEAALALADSDDEEALRQSLDELGALGARPASAIVTRQLRRRGARGLPRGPRRTTRENPAGLTAREAEVLALLVQGLRNAEIAQRLVVSEKTVDHHVSAILRKLDVHSRGAAAAEAQRLGLGAVAGSPSA